MTNIVSIDVAAICITALIDANEPAFLWGPPGVGKSEAIRQIAKDTGRGLIDFRASLRDPVDLRGLPLVDEKTNKTRWLSPHELPNVERDGARGILFMDELNVASQAMQAACFGLVLERRIGEYVLPEGWVPIAAGNRRADRAAAQRMPTALRNRFAHFEVEADLGAWCKWATIAGIDPQMIAFLRYRTELLHVMPAGDQNAFPTPRAWAKVAKIINQPESVRHHLIRAIVGEGAAAECEGFLRLWANLPPIAEILRSPTTAKKPGDDQPAEMYAVATALARKVDRTTFGNALIYAKRLPAEYGVIIAKDAVARDPKLKETEAFVSWALENKDVVL